MWLQSITVDKQIVMNVYNQFSAFKLLSLQTKHKIVYEITQTKTYGPGELVKEMAISSPWNENNYGMYESYKPIINTLEDGANQAKQQQTKKENESIYQEYINKMEVK